MESPCSTPVEDLQAAVSCRIVINFERIIEPKTKREVNLKTLWQDEAPIGI